MCVKMCAKEIGILIDKPKREKPETAPRILLLWQKVSVKRHQHQFTVVLNNWTFRRHHWDEFPIKTLVWRHTNFNCFRSWSQLTIQCVFASLSGPAIDLQKMPILERKIIFSDEAHFDLGGYVNKPNCRLRGTENPQSYIEKPTHPKRVTVWCGFWARDIIGPFIFEKEQGEAVTVNDDRYRAMLNEFLFMKIEEENIASI